MAAGGLPQMAWIAVSRVYDLGLRFRVHSRVAWWQQAWQQAVCHRWPKEHGKYEATHVYMLPMGVAGVSNHMAQNVGSDMGSFTAEGHLPSACRRCLQQSQGKLAGHVAADLPSA